MPFSFPYFKNHKALQRPTFLWLKHLRSTRKCSFNGTCRGETPCYALKKLWTHSSKGTQTALRRAIDDPAGTPAAGDNRSQLAESWKNISSAEWDIEAVLHALFITQGNTALALALLRNKADLLKMKGTPSPFLNSLLEEISADRTLPSIQRNRNN
jgi:hypothetical protein